MKDAEDTYIPRGKLPHAILTLANGIKGENRLLRSEIITIAAAMITRLELPELQPHVIIPVIPSYYTICVLICANEGADYRSFYFPTYPTPGESS